MKKILLWIILLHFFYVVQAQYNVKMYEYWVDDNIAGKVVTSIPPVQTYILETNLPLGQVSNGFHLLNLRFADSQNVWSGVLTQYFVKYPQNGSVNKQMVAYEYWIDDNYAARVIQNITPSQSYQLNSNLNLSSSSVGFHLLNIRFKDSYGQWSGVLTQYFMKYPQNGSVNKQVVAYEYWIDDNYAARVIQNVTPSQPFQLNSNLNLSSCTLGFHLLNIRFKDSYGQWSGTLTQYFMKYRNITADTNKNVAYKIWFDDNFTSAETIELPQHVRYLSLIDSVETPFLTIGLHSINYIFKDSLRTYSGFINGLFAVTSCLPHPGKPISGPSSVCLGQAGVNYYSIPIKNAVSYIWSLPTGVTITAGSNTNSITVTYSSNAVSGSIKVKGVNSCGVGLNSQPLSVTVNPLPIPGLSGQSSACIGIPGNVYTTEPGMSNYTWSVSTGGIITSGSGTNSITVTWQSIGQQTVTVNYTSVFGCRAEISTVKTITVNSLPVPTITGSSEVCQNTTGVAYTTENGMTGYNWMITSGGVITSGAGTNQVTVNWIVPGTHTLTVNYLNSNGCPAITPTIKSILVKPLPTVNFISSQTYCHQELAPSTTLSGSIPGTAFNWINSNPSIGLAANGTGSVPGFLATNTGVSSVNAVVTITPTAYGCVGPVSSYTITVNPTPSVYSISNQVYVNGELAPMTPLSGPVSGTSFSWINNNPSIGLGTSGSGNIPGFLATNIGSSSAVATITISPSANGCFGNSQMYNITVNPSTVTCTLYITPTNRSVAASPSGSTSFLVTSNCPWTAVSDQTWCTVTPSGSGNGTIVANYAVNTLPVPRTATITVTVAGVQIQVTVTQGAGPCTLSVTPANQTVPASPAGSTTFSVSSNCPWTALSSQTWCTVTPSGSGNGTIVANYAVNTLPIPRTATITVTVAGVQTQVTVTQGAGPCTLSVTPANQTVPASPAGSTTFSVSSNCPWTAVSDQTWCTVTPSGSGNGTIVANYAVNTLPVPRTATITVTVAGVQIQVTVSQAAALPCPPPWQPAQNQQYSMSVVANLFISNVLSTSENDAVGAFVGQECRGLAYPIPSMNGLIFLTITSNVASGETVTFKAWKSATCEECPIAETLPFVDQSEIGTIANPFAFHCGSVQQCINFGAGYTWFSVNVDPGSMSLNSLFSGLNACENDRIIGQQTFATYYSGQWVGSLSAISSSAMYKMKLCTQQNWCTFGNPVPIVPISIGSGYPWIGYLPQSDLPINTALTGIVPAPVLNDRFNAQTSFAVNNGNQWVGSLATLQKGKGYVIHLANPSVLTYPTGLDHQVPVEPGETPVIAFSPTGDYPRVNPQYNMQIIATIVQAGIVLSTDDDNIVFVYCGNECRGMAGLLPGLDGKIFLTVGSDNESGEKLTFRVYLSKEKALYEVNNSLEFSSLLETGTMEAPYEINLAGANVIPVIQNGGEEIQIGEIYPNPFDAFSSIDMTLTRSCHISAAIINNIGIIKDVVINDEMNPGKYTLALNAKDLIPGMYTLRITYEDEMVRRIFAKKMIVW